MIAKNIRLIYTIHYIVKQKNLVFKIKRNERNTFFLKKNMLDLTVIHKNTSHWSSLFLHQTQFDV